jgi:hypothetical protein
MNQGLRVAAATAILLGGVFVAMLFRRVPPHEWLPGAESGDQLVLRKHIEAPLVPQAAAASCEEQIVPARAMPQKLSPSARGPTVLRPADRSQPPPETAKDSPDNARAAAGPFTASVGIESADAAFVNQPRTHKLVDGDTLRALAERYLGSADQAWLIYEANRNVLSNPEILPIGAELTVPPKPSAPAAPSYMPKRPLVPVKAGAAAKRQKTKA